MSIRHSYELILLEKYTAGGSASVNNFFTCRFEVNSKTSSFDDLFVLRKTNKRLIESFWFCALSPYRDEHIITYSLKKKMLALKHDYDLRHSLKEGPFWLPF